MKRFMETNDTSLFCTRTDRHINDFKTPCLEKLKERVFERMVERKRIPKQTISEEQASEIYFSIDQDFIGYAYEFDLLYMD